jgi:hypothetical protein
MQASEDISHYSVHTYSVVGSHVVRYVTQCLIERIHQVHKTTSQMQSLLFLKLVVNIVTTVFNAYNYYAYNLSILQYLTPFLLYHPQATIHIHILI